MEIGTGNQPKTKDAAPVTAILLSPLAIAPGIAFLACWMAAVSHWGWLLGVLLGWLPAILLSALCMFVARLIMIPLAAIMYPVETGAGALVNYAFPNKAAFNRFLFWMVMGFVGLMATFFVVGICLSVLNIYLHRDVIFAS